MVQQARHHASRRARWCRWPLRRTARWERARRRVPARRRAQRYVRPVTWLDAPADKGPKFDDHGGRYSIFLRRLRGLTLARDVGVARTLHHSARSFP